MRILLLFITLFSLSTSLIGQTYLAADFEQGVPSDWTAESCWFAGDSASISSKNFKIGEHTNFVAVNDDVYENGLSRGGLVSSEIDLTNAKHVVFSMDFFYFAADDEVFSISIQKENGEWEKFSNDFYGCPCWRKLFFNLSSYIGSKIKIKFDYSDGGLWNFGVGIDNVIVREAKETEGFFYLVEPSNKRITNQNQINYKIGFCSIGAKSLDNIKVKFEGNNYAQDQSLDNVNFFDSTIITINNLDIGAYDLTPSVFKGSTKIIESHHFVFELFPSIPQFIANDIDGNNFNLHEKIINNQQVLLYFITSWCDDCKNNISKLNEIKSEFPDLEIAAIYLNTNATKQYLKNLNLQANFPSFAYSMDAIKEYSLFSQGFEQSVPFSILICPDIYQPEWSEVSWSSNSWDPGTVNAIKSYLRNCSSVTNSDIIDDQSVAIYPNPSDGMIYIEYPDVETTIEIEVVNLLGESIKVDKFTMDGKVALDLQYIKGLFFVKVKLGNKIITKKIEIF